MGFLNLFRRPDMSEGLARYEADAGAALIDVRTPEEYGEGRIPGSVNIPLNELNRGIRRYSDLHTPLYLYCLTGARSGCAVTQLQRLGYTKVFDLGGIVSYHGKVEK